MAYAYPGDGTLDYFPCRYGTSRLLFRGPRRDLGHHYAATLGGVETYGKFVPHPYPDLLETALDCPVANLGTVAGGLEVYLNDPAVLDVAARASLAVVQVVGVQNLSNRFYSVHPRRNDRFVSATPALRSLFRNVDFTEFTFTRHLLQTLQSESPDRFEIVAEELRAVWLARMKALLGALQGQRLLLWLAPAAPPNPGGWADLRQDPLLVHQAMIAQLRPLVAAVVEVRAHHAGQDLSGMAFSAFDRPAAASLPGPATHRAAAQALAAQARTLL